EKKEKLIEIQQILGRISIPTLVQQKLPLISIPNVGKAQRPKLEFDTLASTFTPLRKRDRRTRFSEKYIPDRMFVRREFVLHLRFYRVTKLLISCQDCRVGWEIPSGIRSRGYRITGDRPQNRGVGPGFVY